MRIYLLNEGTAFKEKNVAAKTVRCLREELDIPASASITVNNEPATNAKRLKADDAVAVIKKNKVGG